MKHTVSKVRARRTKSRERQAGRNGSATREGKNHPFIGFAVAFLLWASAVAVIGMEGFLSNLSGPDFWVPLAGRATFLLAGLFATGVYLEIVSPNLLRRNSRITLLAVISLLSVLAAKGILYMTQGTGMTHPAVAVFCLPFALAPLLATLMLESAIGVAVGVWTSLAIALLVDAPFGLPMLITGIVASVVTSRAARQARKRANVTRCGLIIGLTEITCVFALTALNWRNSEVSLVIRQAGACLLSGFLSAVVVLMVMPVFESLFGITSDITLLELSDLGHPLLQRLALEAPGTYHHSLVVANLAQAAADEIGANSMLARVASYFHDIGKLVKPGFFAENLQLQRNPHDELQPSMSTLVITSHVKEGISLAMLYKLPAPIMRVISEHHGTSLLSCFHHKAVTQHEKEGAGGAGQGGKVVDDSDFRYSGPRPATRESAIICIADAVEAASRTMEKTSPGHIESLVREIVNRRFIDGQLSACSLTLLELERVQRSFVFTLTNMLHGRVPYPKDENRDRQQAKTTPGQQTETRPFDAIPDDAGRPT